MDVDAFAEVLPARLFAAWARYLAAEPDLGTRMDMQTGIVAASSLWPHQRKGKKTKPRDLMPKWGGRQRRSSGMHFLAWASSNGAKLNPKTAEMLNA